ncbi:sn-glycerol-3-phosphate ABC transporter ATP-binding protein UgpC [Hoyosella rhizosphaerae]|uniref:Trehalose import ATP-binding protein SugC n=1 Tax=Hoyosella rhizosphaerae TaxID=1755582 RepID=A0A916UI62_9ACTN|nr:sn-glycerol-3-phosphate ABC transporter ATP-binding protein UgpC [Hoyosella rhizosphaerae]MBN4928151.1 sn-glycerol-3-phosphate ABC transporter ATP-binding protein UgpC [Hoyosella rhizosphaerae]GGC72821.1 sugar ABC transporter ATP-binding protein [Hoyosella rhizosphaerae]
MAGIRLDNVTHRYPGSDIAAVDALSLTIDDGEFLVLVGPSGCGKSTTLRMLAGLESVEGGAIHIGDTNVTHLPPTKRDVAMVFQSYALYPNMTVEENMEFALRNAGVAKAERKTKVAEAARMLDLEALLDRKPARLSGGQRQRVAMGRAIVRHPKVFCMDEPLSNLDAKLRVSTRSQIASLQRRLGVTTVYVTHDQVEAMTMGDRVAVLNGGKLQQVASPRDLYDDPDNAFVAEFIGSPAMNLITASVEDGRAIIGGLRIRIPRTVQQKLEGNSVVVGIRPEAFDLATEDDSVAMRVVLHEELGSEGFAYGVATNGDGWTSKSGQLVMRLEARTPVRLGEVLRARPNEREVLFFEPSTGMRLRS